MGGCLAGQTVRWTTGVQYHNPIATPKKNGTNSRTTGLVGAQGAVHLIFGRNRDVITPGPAVGFSACGDQGVVKEEIMSTIDITVAEQPSTVQSNARTEKTTTPVQHIPGFYVGTTFIPDSAPAPNTGLAQSSPMEIAQQWMASAKRSSSLL